MGTDVMVESMVLAIAAAAFGQAVAKPRFADDFPQGIGYVAVLEVVPDEDGLAKTCALSSIRELGGEMQAAKISPPDAFVVDACRKLHTAKWQVKRDQSGNIEPQFYFCRYIETSADVAFCDRQLGE